MGNNKLVTVGTRHVKVWKIEDANATLRLGRSRQSDMSFLSSAIHRTLPGRNCILESLKDATFTSVVTISPEKAIVASDKGELCLIDDSESEHRFSKLMDSGLPISSMAVDVKGRLHIAGGQGGLKTLNIHDVVRTMTPPPSPSPRVESPIAAGTGSGNIGAVGCLNEYVITVDSQRAIRLSKLCSEEDEAVVGDVLQVLPAHGDAVLGVNAGLSQSNSLDASYYTWAADGTIIFWSHGASKGSLQVPLEQMEGPDALSNELRTVRVSVDGGFLVTGDKYGVLR